MKTTLTFMLASITVALTAAASPSLRLDMIFATSADRIVSRPSIIVQSGKRGVISSGEEDLRRKVSSELTCAVTPTLLDHGTVDIQMLVTQRKGEKTDRHAARIVVPLDKLAKVKVGELVVTAKPTLVK